MSNYAGRSQEDRIAQRKGITQTSQEQPGGSWPSRALNPTRITAAAC